MDNMQLNTTDMACIKLLRSCILIGSL